MVELHVLKYATLTGIYAALAGVTGKLTASEDDARWLCLHCSKFLMFSGLVSPQMGYCSQRLSLVRLGFFMLTVFVNSLLWTSFTKTLSYSATSLQGTVIVSAANMLITALISQIVFGEILGRLWWCGFSLIVLGLVLIYQASVGLQTTHEKV